MDLIKTKHTKKTIIHKLFYSMMIQSNMPSPSSSIDDVLFSLAKGGSTVASTATSAATSVIKRFDPSSLIGGMGRGSYFNNLSLPEIPLSTSKLFHTGEALESLKKVDLGDLIPDDTNNILKGLNKNIDEVSGVSDDFATSLAKTNVGLDDADALKSLASNTSLSKLKGLNDDLASLAAKNTGDLAGNSKLLKTSDDLAENAGQVARKSSFKNADEMTDSLKSSTGLAKQADDVAGVVDDVAEKGLKKADDKIDDLAKQADEKTGFWKKLKDNDGKIQFGIVAAFMMSRHINGNAPWSGSDFEELADPVAVGEIEQISYDLDLEDIIERNNVPEDNALQSNALTLAVIAASVAFMSL